MKPDEVLDMDIALFLGLRKEFFIMDLEKTKEGREALKNTMLDDDGDKYNTKAADVNKVKAFIKNKKTNKKMGGD